jgi:hypothetical protein
MFWIVEVRSGSKTEKLNASKCFPLITQERKYSGHRGTSHLCQQETHAPQQKYEEFSTSFVDVPKPRPDDCDMSMIAQLASDDVLDGAYAWRCRRRRDYSANSDVWSFRRGWLREKAQIKGQLLSGNYRFSLLSRVTLKDGEETDLWSARDALMLKPSRLCWEIICRCRAAARMSRATVARSMPCGR